MQTREQLANKIDSSLSNYAVKNAANWQPEGISPRQFAEPEHVSKLPFQRDRDRIIHSNAFRRLKHKTQVLISFFGDHYRDRLTHSLEASQIARSISRQLSLNEELTETIALAHDLGHPPFGHGGEDTLNELMSRFGEKFNHNLQSKRVVELLENRYPDFPGLNLTWEVRQGLMKHQSRWEAPESGEPACLSLEAQIVDLSDAIAYIAADVDDGLRAGIIKVEDLRHLKLYQRVVRKIEEEYPLLDASSDIGRYQVSRSIINELVGDIINQTEANLAAGGIKTLEDVYVSAVPLVGFSDEIQAQVDEIKSFLFDNFYANPKVMDQIRQGQFVIQELFEKFYSAPELMPIHVQRKIYSLEVKHVVVKDYIAGMTDNFARQTWQNLVER